MRSAGEAKLRRRFGALLRRLRGAAFRFLRIYGFPRHHLFLADPCLQRRGGARLGFGALGGERLAPALGRDARLQRGGRFRFRLFTPARDLDRILGRFGPRQGAATQLVVERHALAHALQRRRLRRRGFLGLAAQRFLRGDARLQLGGIARVGLRRLALARRLDRGRFRRRERLRALVQAVFRLGTLPRGGGEGLLRRDARLRFGERARLDFLALARRQREVCLGLQPLLGAAAQLGVHRLALAREARRVGLDVGAHVRRVLGRLLRRGLQLRRLERLRLGIRALARLLLVGELPGALLGIAPRLLLLEMRALDVAALLCQAPRFGLRRGARLGLALELVFSRRALSCRLERPLLGLQTLARRAPRQLFGRSALAHRRGRLALGLGPLARVLRGLFLLLAAALGQRRGLLLRCLARFRLGGRLRFGALALGDHARRLRLGFGARIGDAPQLDFRRLALARHVQPALLLAQLCLRRLAGAALGLDAVALRSGAQAVRSLQLVEQLAHLLGLALALAGEKSRLIMSPRESE